MYITAGVHVKEERILEDCQNFSFLPDIIFLQLGWTLIEAQNFSIPPLFCTSLLHVSMHTQHYTGGLFCLF